MSMRDVQPTWVPESWEIGWTCALIGHDFGGKGVATAHDIREQFRQITVAAVCVICEKPVAASERFRIHKRWLEAEEQAVLKDLRKKLMLADRNQRRWL